MEVREVNQKALIMDKNEAKRLGTGLVYLKHRLTNHGESNGVQYLVQLGITANFVDYILGLLDEW